MVQLQLCDLFLLLPGEVPEVWQRLSGADDVLQVDNRFAFVRASGRGRLSVPVVQLFDGLQRNPNYCFILTSDLRQKGGR